MTEAEWHVCSDLCTLIQFIRNGSLSLYDDTPAATRPAMREHLLRLQSSRRIGLFGCACCRVVWELLPDKRSRGAINITESYLDGHTDEHGWMTASFDAEQARETVWSKRISGQKNRARRAATVAAARATSLMAMDAAAEAATAIAWTSAEPVLNDAESRLADLFRDIFGNPFRPVAFDPKWRSADVVGVARGVYEHRAFDRLPILADALMDAGCADEQVLGHCRGDGPHVRGCWVVDLVLEKE